MPYAATIADIKPTVEVAVVSNSVQPITGAIIVSTVDSRQDSHWANH